MITRRWSEWVFVEYADDDGSIFGGDLLRVVDTRENVAPQEDCAESERLSGYDENARGERTDGDAPHASDLTPTCSQQERSPALTVPNTLTRRSP